ncbi:glycosyltransferase [Streptomyces muensis]|uniref:Glycosyltransferase n=1 Tax=Streptomyces muensis TaxID=1077944 RepID=A0A9X1Q0H7_STRM4|nr:glycosyltransferase [Streptomyces muensis]MCF1595879.1 glycosyltransferase [Streptomyces muensis]
MIETTPPSVDVVLPCLDEAEALPWVLDRIPPGWRAIVVDKGSSDSACRAGLTAATADIVGFCDFDASLDPHLLPRVVGPVLDGSADLVLGRRRRTTFGAWPLHARLANLELARLIHRRTGLALCDLGSMRAARGKPLPALGLTDRRSGHPQQMVVRAADAGWRMQETDAPYHPRTGRSKVTGTWLVTWRAVRDMRTVLAECPVTGPIATLPGGAR